jgi:hypothetical protein
MAQQDYRHDSIAPLASNMSPDRTPDHLEVFSPPAVEVVFRWWVESNRRWAERNRLNGLRGSAPGVDPF